MVLIILLINNTLINNTSSHYKYEIAILIIPLQRERKQIMNNN